ncbi:hypothetical protein A3K86_13915 [Photobacterium jeanii]|uniref:Uncharacterized protein n=1 Tax=Photobacterium jeanii TaxID=858640 RepID=A0A178K982_9GAMM|nr:tetratricopeptide repeat protein [Photobacterium jeanii]OAN13667.1 hypothetical protein A3K86_13915 [Photobacterium jeanii]PST88788.1 hypothetical protein C9I91_15780 [Photobacterium jeanii]
MKKLCLLTLVAILAGCSNSPKHKISDEERMEITQNYDGLQENYRARLKANPKDYEALVKLSGAYFKDGDIEAASYYIDQVPDDNCSQINGCWLTRADIAYNNKDYSQAKYYIDYSLAVGKDVYAVKNLYGIMLARQGNFELARQYFFEARVGFKSEDAIKNNLAMTEMMEGKYEKAAERLMPLYQKNRFDAQIKANLIVSLMLSSQYSKVRQLLLQEMSEEEAAEMFEQLREDLQQPATLNLPALDNLQQSQNNLVSDQHSAEQDEES